jgi:hypothetical protein
VSAGDPDGVPTPTRAQLSLTAVEAFVGALLVVGVAVGFAVGGGGATADEGARLDAHAADGVAVLAAEGDGNLTALARNGTFDRARAPARARLTGALPGNVLFRVVTPHGAVGYPRPADDPIGRASRVTIDGTVTVWVWYQ